jgi:excisionase family DNA binding protein
MAKASPGDLLFKRDTFPGLQEFRPYLGKQKLSLRSPYPEKKMENQNKNWLTVHQAATLTNTHPNTIRNLIAHGKLKAYKFGGKLIRIMPEDLNSLAVPFGGEFVGGEN